MSVLMHLRRSWDSFANKDALYAICKDPQKVGRWDRAEFMASGEMEVARVLDYVTKLGINPDFSGEALDFGCGVGRLTQPLARRFSRCWGLDISSKMIEIARTMNTQNLPCCFSENREASLALFADGTLSFIYSNIVLQHIPPQYSVQYLKEFVRVLRPDGVLVFQVIDSLKAPFGVRWKYRIRLRSRIKLLVGIGQLTCMYCIPEARVRAALLPAHVRDVAFTNATLSNFDGDLIYLGHEPSSGYISKQYCVTRN